MITKDTIITSTGTIEKIAKNSLRVNYGVQQQENARSDFFMLGTVDIEVDDNGNITSANQKTGYDISVTGRFEGNDKLSMKIDVLSTQYGKLFTNNVDGIRN